ncbi:MAG: TonB-dependent siderophore receptor [Sphingopyxis sp.]|uniref:TonB-dependent receptor n=1 Tax=Sphingopyxis sp. TaxID=1908224 RepID=UPI001A32FA37|nr:TonB-dependent siderophore receptor [Sphingopyxis sp.]MBJ7498330.1 TonB-dependent siderophore receptor [Sphingopyxis sp.]
MAAFRGIIQGTSFLTLGAALAVSAPAFAQEAGESESIVVTAQRSNETQVVRGGSLGALGDKDAMETPFAVKAYSETLILNQQPLTLGAVLENDPSVRTSLGFGNASEQFVIRGFPLYGEDIAIDGLYGVTPRQLVSPELYDQVMVLNGASAFLFGAAPGGTALGGTVNLQPKRAKDKDTNRVTANYLSDGHLGGAFDFGRRFGDDGAFGARVNGAGRWGDIAIDDEYRSSVVVGAGLDWRSERARLSLDLAFQRAKVEHMRPMVQLNGVTAVPDAPKATLNYGQEWNYTTLRDIFGIVKFEYDISDDFMFYAAAGARDAAERGVYQGLQVTDAQTGAAFVTGSNIPRNDNNESGQVGIRGKFATGPITHEINLGASHSRYVNRNAYEFGPFGPPAAPANNIYNPVQVAKPTFNALVAGDLQDPNPANRTRLTSFFVSDTIGAFDEKVELTLGLRRQEIFFRTYNITTGAQLTRYKERATTPVVGLVIRPSERFSIYANRIEGLVQGPVAPAGTINAGDVFPPFKTKQYEIGGKVALGSFNASVALFQTDRPQALTIINDQNQSEFTVNGLQRNKGIEFSLDGEPVKGLRVIAGLSLTDAKQRRTQNGTTDGRDAIGVPDYTANLNVEWDLGFLPGVTLTGRVMQTGKQAVNLTNTLELPEWTRFDLGARYVVAAGDTPITFRFNVDNVANDNYWSSSLGGYLVQGLPRTFKTSVTVDF